MLVEALLQGLAHLTNELIEPTFDLCCDIDWLLQVDRFLVVIDKLHDLIAFLASAATACLSDIEGVHALEHLSDVLKDWLRVFGLANDFQKILVRQEVESRELRSLGFQELLQILLNILELFIQFVEVLKEVLFLSECSLAISVFANPLHLIFELHMVSSEDGIFVRKLL
jgi:hypothetical protein